MDRKYQPSGSYLPVCQAMMEACHFNTMLTYVDKSSDLRAQSDLASACGVKVAHVATSSKKTVRCFARIEYLPTWARSQSNMFVLFGRLAT